VNNTINDYRDLRVWQGAMDLVTQVYEAIRGFPRVEQYGLSAQLRRSAVSIPSNIAEGHARESTKEYLQHLSIAQGSLAEIATQIEIARRLGYLEEAESQRILDRARTLAKQIFALRNALLPKLDS
jgi:four helix bundle protein